MRKIVAIIAAVVVIVGTSAAVDMAGKIGFGVGPLPLNLSDFKPGSILEPGVFSIRVGVSNPVAIEPQFAYYSIAYDSKIDSSKISGSDVGLSLRGLYAFLKTDKSNLYGTGGFRYDMVKATMENYSSDSLNAYKIPVTGSLYNVFLGVALEHFINPSFSVCISTESGYIGGSLKSEATIGTVTQKLLDLSGTGLFFGNRQFSIMFFLYL